MSRVMERVAARPRTEEKKSHRGLSIVAGALQGLVIGLQIALLLIWSDIPAVLQAALPGDESFFLAFAMVTGGLAGAIGTVGALIAGDEREKRNQ